MPMADLQSEGRSDRVVQRRTSAIGKEKLTAEGSSPRRHRGKKTSPGKEKKENDAGELSHSSAELRSATETGGNSRRGSSSPPKGVLESKRKKEHSPGLRIEQLERRIAQGRPGLSMVSLAGDLIGWVYRAPVAASSDEDARIRRWPELLGAGWCVLH
ncbi:unnamed protein product [Linum trigynum]|uniref:Uncharacterized protein n=1 Tax=Linum trigynum TaxID=586398 RepID=A0AAV2GPZ9_9ROSI